MVVDKMGGKAREEEKLPPSTSGHAVVVTGLQAGREVRECAGQVGRQMHGAGGVGGGSGGVLRTAQPGETLQRDGRDGCRGHLTRPHLWLQVVSVAMRQEKQV